MQVGGKSLQIDKNDPKYQEIYNTQIKPLIDKINAVDEVAPVEVDPIKNIKQKQLDKVLKLNPMLNDVNTGIRTIDDIKTYQEAFDDPESFVYPDYSKAISSTTLRAEFTLKALSGLKSMLLPLTVLVKSSIGIVVSGSKAPKDCLIGF